MQMLDLDIEFLELSGTEIHKLNQSFDVVIYYAALEHMTIEERIESLQQAFSLLSKNGYLIIIEAPNRLWIEDTILLNCLFSNGYPIIWLIFILNLAKAVIILNI